MTRITQLEQQVLFILLQALVGDSAKAQRIVDAAEISRREISADVLDKDKCGGFYLHFVSTASLASTHPLPHHVSVHATHLSSPAGADFILFFDQNNNGLDYLEASFFDATFPIADITSANHGFSLEEEVEGVQPR